MPTSHNRLGDIRDVLLLSLPHAEAFGWLVMPNEALGDKTPWACIQEGQFEAVYEVALALDAQA